MYTVEFKNKNGWNPMFLVKSDGGTTRFFPSKSVAESYAGDLALAGIAPDCVKISEVHVTESDSVH